MACNCHVNESAKSSCDIVLGRDLLTALSLNIKFSKKVINVHDRYLKGSSAPMVNLGKYTFKYLKMYKLHPRYHL